MAAIQSLKKQLRGIRSTQKLAKAMKTISTVKFSKLNGVYSGYSAYGKQCEQMYRQFGDAFLEIVGEGQPDAPVALVVIAGNKGLCGSFNSEVLQYAKSQAELLGAYRLIPCGKKAIQYFKTKKMPAEKEVVFGDVPSIEETSRLLDELLLWRKEGRIGKIMVVYPQYRNMMLQQPVIREFFGKGGHEASNSLFVPDQATLAEQIARKSGANALITGESLGQVASQTLLSMVVTDDAAHMPVFRPCIGLDKEEIVVRARQIGTFEISTLPYEDCCAMFTPKHPNTRPKLEDILAEEAKLDVEGLVARALESDQIVFC